MNDEVAPTALNGGSDTTQPDAIDDSVLPCPFCGEYPWVDNDPDSCGGTIECMGSTCHVRPSIYIDHEQHLNGNDAARIAWNTRATPRAQP